MGRRAAGIRLSMPNTFARPEVGWAQESSIFTKVVFPAPFGPSSPNVVPRSTHNETFSTARNPSLLQRRRNVFDKPSVSMARSTASTLSYATLTTRVPLHYGKLVLPAAAEMLMRTLVLFLSLSSLAWCENSLSRQERKEGFESVFDGKTLAKWHASIQSPDA